MSISSEGIITLTLNNFKKYDCKTSFRFQNNGLILIQGPSGIGKTTILDAIYFVLYGMGSKVINFNSINCSVVMEDNIRGSTIITRSKGPNRLTLKKDDVVYEDVVAQEIINSKYGTDFEVTSYIKYKGSTSFLSLGPSGRMEFLQKISVKGTDVQGLKIKTKEAIKIRKERLLHISTELKVVEGEFDKLTLPDEIEFPLGKKYNAIKVKNHKIRSKNNTIKINNTEKTLKALYKTFNNYKLQLQANKFIQDKIQEYENRLAKLKDQLSLIKYEDTSHLENILNKIETNKAYEQLEKEIHELHIQYNECKDTEDIQKQTALHSLQQIIPVEDKRTIHQSNMELKNTIIKTEIRLSNNLKQLNNYSDVDIETINKLDRKLISSTGKQYNCPSCNCSLLLKDEKLMTYTNDQDNTDTTSLRNTIKNIKDKLNKKSLLQAEIEKDKSFLQNYNDFDKNIDYECIYKDHLKEFEKWEKTQREIERLKNMSYSSSLKALEKKIIDKRNKLSTYKYISIDYGYGDINNIQKQIHKQQADNNTYNTINSQIKDLQYSIDKEKSKITQLVDKDYIGEINGLEFTLKELKMENILISQIDQKLIEYEKYKDQIDNYNNWKSRVTDLRFKESNCIKSLQVAEGFLNLLIRTESKAVANTINSININLKYYCDQFFNEPIDIQIQPFKETLKGNIKPTVNIKLSYKGMDYDIDCLSGGETSRIELAICLAINNVIGGKILLLDEVLGTLNAGYIETIINVLREEAIKDNKLIITILHGASEGIFDQVINIE